MRKQVYALGCIALCLCAFLYAIFPIYATENTFGKTSIGGSSDSFGEEILLVCKFTSPADFGTATKISVYTKAASGTINAIAVIYADSSGSPAARLAESSEVTDIGETAAWTNFTISYAGSPNTVYWLGIHGSDNFLVYYDAGTSHQVRYLYPHNYPTNSNPFYLDEGWWLSWSASIYAVYTASTGISGSNISTNTTIAGQVCNFSTYWTSQSGTCDFYIFGTNNTGTWVNDTATPFSGASVTDWSNITKTLNTTTGERVEWRIWANNSVDTWGSIALQYVVTTNQISVSSVGRTTSLAGISCKFYAYWITVSGTLDSYIFGTNNTGVWVNETKADFAGTPTEDWSNITKTLNDTAGYMVQWQIWVNNTGGAEVNTGLQSFTLTTWASEKYTVYATSGYRQAIQIAINDVRSNGDNPPEREGVVIVPGGNWTLDATGGIGGSTALYAIDTIYWYVHSYGGIDIIGNGKYDTNLTLLPNEATYPAVSMFFVDGSNQKPFTISGISFYGRTGAAASATGDTGILIDSAKDFRVCHSSFDFMGSGGVASTGSIVSLTTRGVIDHCNFTRMYKEDAVTAGTGYGYGVALDRSYQKGGGMQDILWDQYGTPSQFLGSYGNVTYVEDNYFQGCRHAICAYASAAYVSRYNTFTEMWVPYSSGYNDIHGAYPDDVYGGRYIEVYNNTFYNPPNKNPYGSDENAMATKNRGGGGVVFNNYIWNLTYAFSIAADDGNDAHPKCKVSNLYFWSNTLVGTTQFSLGENYDNRVLGTDYFTNAPTSFTYVSYQYPHPLTQTEEGIIVMLVNPNATIYYSSTIPVQISAQGGTIDDIWWNCKNSTSWIYGSNQTYTVTTSMTGFINGTAYTFYAWANNTLSITGEAILEFDVEIPAMVLTITSPTSQQYPTGTISVQLSATGGTIDKIWWNCKSGASWVYGSNQTYTTPTQMTGFNTGNNYMFYGWANNTVGNNVEATVTFTVLIAVQSNTWWGSWW